MDNELLIDASNNGDAQNNEDNSAAMPEDKTSSIPPSIKYTLTVLLVCFGIAIGSTGHSIYTAKKGLSTNFVTHYGAMMAKMDTTADPCNSLYRYACGAYETNHMPYGRKSVFGDLQEKTQAIAYRAFDSYVNKHPNALASLFYTRCRGDPYGNDNGCIIAGTPGLDLVKKVVEHGYALNGIYADRTTNPYKRSARTFALFPETYTSGSSNAPLQLASGTDPCNFFEFRDIIFPACKTSVCEDLMLIYGDVDEVCRKWKTARNNLTHASIESRDNATALCEYETRWSRRHYSAETCMIHTSKFYPDVSIAMTQTNKWDTSYVHHLFSEIQAETTLLVASLGARVAEKISEVQLHAGWTPQNLNPGPPRLAFTNVTYSKLYMNFRSLVQRETLSQKMMISPMFAMDAWEVNAYYQPSENNIYVLDSLQFLENPNNLFSNGLAFILAHELAHSFDPSSVQYDENGLFATSLLDENGAMHYNRYVNCVSTSRPRQLAEDFADNIAAQVVMKLQSKHRVESVTLDNIQYSSDRISLIEMAQLWCESYRPVDLSDSHSPSTLRVDSTLSTVVHSPFHCRAEHVCRL